MMREFENPLTDAAALRKILGKPQSAVANKSLDHLGKHCRTFIGRSPFVLSKPQVFMPYIGYPAYVEKCRQVVASGYEEFHLS